MRISSRGSVLYLRTIYQMSSPVPKYLMSIQQLFGYVNCVILTSHGKGGFTLFPGIGLLSVSFAT